MHFLLKLRYALEMVAVPFFALLVVHIAGHGAMLLFEDHEEGEVHVHEGILETFFSIEGALGVAFLIFAIWIWNFPALKKWVPCRHEHCHTESKIPHLFALFAFVLHFFPESAIRAQVLNDFSSAELLSIAGIIGFASHFLVDIVVAITLSLYWKTPLQKILSLGGITVVWGVALWWSDTWEVFLHTIPEVFQGLGFLVSAFLLAMFVHFPHQEKSCHSCEHS